MVHFNAYMGFLYTYCMLVRVEIEIEIEIENIIRNLILQFHLI